ncbi:chemokine-like factor [Strix aluco]|uniref:chemokine-like factor n=1 Tax=Strix aluco TaxID=111821 RepID=UPI003DA4B261
MALDSGFPRSPRGAVKIARAVVAFGAFLCFAASRAPGAYTALAGLEALSAALLLLLYLLQLDAKTGRFFWPLADVFNSVISALFLLVVCLFAVIIKTNKGTLAGGVLGLVLLVLCIVDAVLLSQKISLDRPRGRTTPAK